MLPASSMTTQLWIPYYVPIHYNVVLFGSAHYYKTSLIMLIIESKMLW